MWQAMKGRELKYGKNLGYVASIKLSGNNFSDDIPRELANLNGLQSVNLSNNKLSGNIPTSIGQLRWLESLDLTRNKFSRSISSSMSCLTSLSHLNLSYNNFSGRITTGYQLQTLNDPSMYIGNPGLCGALFKIAKPMRYTMEHDSLVVVKLMNVNPKCWVSILV